MGSASRVLVLCSCLLAWSGSGFAVVQEIDDTIMSNTIPLDGNGALNGIQFDNTTAKTVTIPGPPGLSTINSNGNLSGVTTNTAFGLLDFQGTSGTSVVSGTVGSNNFPLADIKAGAGTSLLNFTGNVNTTTMEITGAGKVQFHGATNAAAITFGGSADGTVEIGTGSLLTGAIKTLLSGSEATVILNSGSRLQGAIGLAPNMVKQLTFVNTGTVTGSVVVNNISLGTGNASIVGQVIANDIDLGLNTLSTQALFIGSGTAGTIHTTVASNLLYGNIIANGCTADVEAYTPLNVLVTIQGQPQLTGAPLVLVCAGSGSDTTVDVQVVGAPPGYSFTATQTSGTVKLFPHYTFSPPANPAAAGPAAVLQGLFSIAGANPSSDLATVMNAVVALPPAQQNAALLQLNPIVDGALTQLSFATAQQFQDLWMRQMGNGRCILATNCSENCAKGVRRTAKEQAECDLKGKKGCYSELNCANVGNNYEVWADGFGYFGHQDARNGHNGYNANMYGGMLGLQVPLNQITSFGVAAGYANTQVERHNHSSIQTWDGTAYLSLSPTNWYLDAAFSFDYNQYKDARHIEFTGIDRTANASYGGQQYTGLLAGGYRLYTDHCLIITPLASLQYSHLNVNKYHENGAGDLDLYVQSQKYNFLESGLGLKLSGPLQTSLGAFVPEIHALWFYDYFGDPMELSTTFSGMAAQGGPIETDGLGNDKNWGDVGAGITFYSCSKLSVELVYNYEFSKTYHAHQGLAKISQRF